MDKDKILSNFRNNINAGHKIVGVSCGTGLTSSLAYDAGADLVLAVSSGIFRQMGLGSFAAYLPCCNSNNLVYELCANNLLPKSPRLPICFGLNATDPSINIKKFISQLQVLGIEGIVNYPSVGLIDGNFGKALEDEQISYAKEIEALRLGSALGMLTVAFAFTEEQAKMALEAKVDILCYHFGLTMGGRLGAVKGISLYAAVNNAHKVFTYSKNYYPKTIRLIYGGPILTPQDLQFVYNEPLIQGFIGGSTFDRIPAEKAIYDKISCFVQDSSSNKKANNRVPINSREDEEKKIVDTIISYTNEHLSEKITIEQLCQVTHTSRSYLSKLFVNTMGVTYHTYLRDTRISVAKELLLKTRLQIQEIAFLCGYCDSSYFYKVFSDQVGISPTAFRKN